MKDTKHIKDTEIVLIKDDPKRSPPSSPYSSLIILYKDENIYVRTNTLIIEHPVLDYVRLFVPREYFNLSLTLSNSSSTREYVTREDVERIRNNRPIEQLNVFHKSTTIISPIEITAYIVSIQRSMNANVAVHDDVKEFINDAFNVWLFDLEK